MIDRHQAMPLLLDACPSFESAWAEHLAENGGELPYVAAGTYAHHLHALYRSGRLECFPAVGLAIERLHLEGSPWVQEFATVGVLEAVQNVWANLGADPEQFALYLGPDSKRWWRGLVNFWAGKAPHVQAEG
ncbi:hypothetical protein ASC95_29665 [Pelomonas sp. Root1217]|uniref:DUF7674 family protein n=1 Tax=Pelomonas sp. Root1217 TaxID=1736430 RepID=UPI000710C4FC|nr:hypothetical protein [Pelomonas sp. Root1217]KQV51690.1 hypothetical protein ASC95_29665 [Pelomonas sp. Root1217]